MGKLHTLPASTEGTHPQQTGISALQSASPAMGGDCRISMQTAPFLGRASSTYTGHYEDLKDLKDLKDLYLNANQRLPVAPPASPCGTRSC